MLLTFLLMVTVGVMVSAMDIYLPSLPYMTRLFDTTEYVMQFSIMVSPLMSALFSLGWGRFSDLNGRRKPFMVAILLFAIGAFISSQANDIYLFMIGRFVQSIGSGGISVLTVVILSDMYSGPNYAKIMATYGLLFPIVFTIAPILGAQLFTNFGWRSNFYLITVLPILLLGYFSSALPETLKKSNAAPAPSLTAFKRLLTDSVFMRLALGHTLPISIDMLFIANASFIFIDRFCYTPVAFSFATAIPVVFNLIGAFFYRHYVSKIGISRSIHIGSVSCFIFGLASATLVFMRHESPLALVIIMCWLMAFLSFTVGSCATQAYESNPDERGLAVAIVTMLRNASAATVTLVCGLFNDGTMFPMLAFMALLGFSVYLMLRTIPQYKRIER